jgi:hypothetical protein
MATKAAEISKPKPSDLYETDFFAWTREQAAVIRSLRDNRLDALRVAEEIEDLGSSELKAVRSYVGNIIEHLLKLDHSSLDWPRSHWRKELLAFRKGLRNRLTPSLKQAVLANLDQLYEHARTDAAASLLDEDPGLIRRLPPSNPYDWAAIETREDLTAEVAERDAKGKSSSKRRRKGSA